MVNAGKRMSEAGAEAARHSHQRIGMAWMSEGAACCQRCDGQCASAHCSLGGKSEHVFLLRINLHGCACAPSYLNKVNLKDASSSQFLFVQQTLLADVFDHRLDSIPAAQVGKHKRTFAPHALGILRHDV